MIILIPLGGIGQRFKDNKYKKPKALINIFGKTIISFLLSNLDIKDEIIYIPYNKEYSNYRIEEYLQNEFKSYNFKFLELRENTRGAVETINIALKNIDVIDQPILCLDGDNFYTNNIIKLWDGENKIFYFEDETDKPIYSYITFENDILTNIVEKIKISNNACTGAYGFKSYIQLLKFTNTIIDNNIMQNNEFYTSGVVKEMISNNIIFKKCLIQREFFHCLGTPLQLKQFYNNYPVYDCVNNKHKIKKIRICFDLDNTLVSQPKISGDYTTVEPILKNINYLKYLKKIGNEIIIYTARRMKTHNGCLGKVNADIGKITFDTLEKFDIPYDEIYFGKPYADVYIDDLALNCFDDMEKELGFYNDDILPRNNNSIEENIIEIYTKKSTDLSGEIYYYKNIPRQVKDMFPLFIDCDIDNKWYSMEKIYGIALSTVYLSELLTEELLINVLNSLRRIHSLEFTDNNINIYDNYCKKIEERYKQYNYNIFENSDIIYNELMVFCTNYEKNNLGKKRVIHGDFVMTNIIINKYNKLKFIDMRGKCGNVLTIYGDELYDWAKFYQSLIGYDKILQGKNISIEYEKKMTQVFLNYFLKYFTEADLYNLKMITKCLLFSLIPIHDNEKCKLYFELINTIK